MYKGIPPTPNPEFVKDLKVFDPKLDVKFDRISERFVITKSRSFGNPFIVLVVAGAEGEFRQPNQSDIKALHEGDLWRHGGVEARVRKGEEYMRRHRFEEQQKITQELRERSLDDKIQLKNTYRKATNQGSKSPEFQKLPYRNPGLTAAQINKAREAGIDPWAATKVA